MTIFFRSYKHTHIRIITREHHTSERPHYIHKLINTLMHTRTPRKHTHTFARTHTHTHARTHTHTHTHTHTRLPWRKCSAIIWLYRTRFRTVINRFYILTVLTSTLYRSCWVPTPDRHIHNHHNLAPLWTHTDTHTLTHTHTPTYTHTHTMRMNVYPLYAFFPSHLLPTAWLFHRISFLR